MVYALYTCHRCIHNIIERKEGIEDNHYKSCNIKQTYLSIKIDSYSYQMRLRN